MHSNAPIGLQARSQPSRGGGGRWRSKRGPSMVGWCVCVWGEGITIVSGPGGRSNPPPPPPPGYGPGGGGCSVLVLSMMPEETLVETVCIVTKLPAMVTQLAVALLFN